jgi:hypothetical protein
MPTLSQSGPPGIRVRHGPEDSVVATDARLDASTHTSPRRSIDDLLGGAETRMTATDVQTIGEAKLEVFVGQAVVDMGAYLWAAAAHRRSAGFLQGDGRCWADHLVPRARCI